VTRIETLETDLGSNVTRIETLETDLGSNVTRIETLETDLGSNVTRIETLETDLGSNVTRIETLETDLGSNVTRIGNLESGDMTIDGEKTFSSNLEVGTANLFVDTTTSRVGINTTTPGYDLDVNGDINFTGTFYQGGSPFVSSLWTAGSDSLYYRSNVEVGTANLFVDTTTGNVGIGTSSPNEKLEIYDTSSTSSGIRIHDSTSNAPKIDFLRGGTSRIGSQTEFGLSDYSDWRIQANGPSLYIYNQYTGANSGSLKNVMTMLHNSGNVGIGTTTPGCNLAVYGNGGYVSGSNDRAYFFTSSGTSLSNDTGAGSGNIVIFSSGWIHSNDGFIATNGTLNSSDTRIKKNIVDADDSECLEVLRLLKPKKYQYKDEFKRGSEPVWGFIAQEVRETLPYATQLRKDVLPNIYELANVSQSNVITFTNFNTSNLESNATTLIRTKGIDCEDHDIHLAEVIDEHTIRVEEDLSEWIGSVDETGNVVAGGNQLFIYGQEVDDFVFLKKEAIWTVATSALQEVDRQLQAEKAKVATLETQLASVLARLDALENT
jgi:hypothetical protein